jgi:hypothetical protein
MNRQSAAAPARRTTLEETIVALGNPGGRRKQHLLASVPILTALRAAGTSHVYADTADCEELGRLLARGDGTIIAELDGNTANQPLVREVLGAYLDHGDPGAWTQAVTAGGLPAASDRLLPILYAIVCGRIGNDVVNAYASGRAWEVSLQLHMRLCGDADAAKHVGRLLHAMVPSALVKVPFTPHEPACLLAARDLEKEGIPVNFTSTFSARQAVTAALLADVTRTNVFMGRLNQGLQAELLGEHVDLETQRALLSLRRSAAVKTQLIVASVHDWRTFVRTAGCDAYTAPCKVITELLSQDEVAASDVTSRLDVSYEDHLGIPAGVLARIDMNAVARLWRVEPELVEFLKDYRRSREYRELGNGDVLARRFEAAGFGDFFSMPAPAEWREIRRSKLPDLGAPLTSQFALDTLYSLLADADFEKYQGEMDAEIVGRIPHA